MENTEKPLFLTDSEIKQILNNIYEAVSTYHKEVLTTREAALFMGTTPQVLRKMASQGRIAYTNPEGGVKTKYYFLKKDLVSYMSKGRINALK